MAETACTREDLPCQLARVAEPCSIAMGTPANIWEMGLVEEDTLQGGRARVVLCLTNPACINYAAIARYVTDALMQLNAVDAVEVTQTTEDRKSVSACASVSGVKLHGFPARSSNMRSLSPRSPWVGPGTVIPLGRPQKRTCLAGLRP
jgi:metal-sulfur cluster biosynthetic enzyme